MKIIRKIGQVLIYLLTFYFIGRIFYQNYPSIKNGLGQINVFYLILAIFLFSLSFWILSIIWHRLINYFNKIKFSLSSYLYFKSQIIRYIPGNIWGLGARVIFFHKVGLKKTEAIFALIYESILLVFSGIVTYFIFRCNLTSPLLLDVVMAVIGLVLLIIIFNPKLYPRLVKLVHKQQELSQFSFNWLQSLAFTFFYLIYWLVCGLGFYFLIIAVTDFTASKLFIAIAVYAVSWVLGYISFITPSGLGVREFSLVWLLSQIITVPLATIIAVFGRIVFILGELLSLAVSFFLNSKSKEQ